jgi:LIVCS family branched-chain amino acid:cation transporter
MNKNIWTVSLAVFTMFFGAGNITLPLLLTQTWPQDWVPALAGFCITGVIVTFIGLIGGVMSRNTKEFFSPLGLTFGFIVQAILICIEGPFGVVPRCLIVAYGGVHSVLPQVNGITFYIVSSILLFFLTVNRTKLVEIVGNYITPMMLSLLAIIVAIVIYQDGNKPLNINFNINSGAFEDGLYKGYLTYDLPGAIYFTTIAMSYLKSLGQSKKAMIINGLKASVISSILLILVYGTFFYIGSRYTDQLQNIPPTQLLPSIVRITCGQILAAVFAAVVFIACISTAIAALTIWTDFIYEIFKRYNVKYDVILLFSIITTAIVSNLEFSGLMKLLLPVLSIMYPFLILLSLYNIITKYKKL